MIVSKYAQFSQSSSKGSGNANTRCLRQGACYETNLFCYLRADYRSTGSELPDKVQLTAFLNSYIPEGHDTKCANATLNQFNCTLFKPNAIFSVQFGDEMLSHEPKLLGEINGSRQP